MPDANRSIHGVFEQMAASVPENIAIEHASGLLSYSELNGRANFLAKYFQDNGLGQGDVIAISLPHSVELAISILAVLKCGAVYLPIDDAYPRERIRLYFVEAGVKACVGVSTQVAGLKHDLLCINAATSDLFTSELSTFKSHPSDSEDPAYVLFTSGSTGMPKGVVVPHRAVIRLVRSTNYIQILPSDKILQFAPPVFDASTFEFWGALLNGATLVPYSGYGLDPNALKNSIRKHKINILWLTAALFHLIADKCIEVLEPLRVLLAGGDVLSPKYVNRVLEHIPGLILINGYGPTENTTFTCCHVMTTENPPLGIVPIGKPIKHTTVFVLDETHNPVEEGQVGELYTSGDGVALGYLNDNAGQDSFFRDKHISNNTIYRTGDLVKVNTNGELEFVGRKDAQIKIRGFRVSVEEVKANIVALPGVGDAGVVLKKFDSGDQLLIAYVQLNGDVELNAGAIKAALGQILPQHMIPDKFIFDEVLPINRSGKIDREKVQLIVDHECVEG